MMQLRKRLESLEARNMSPTGCVHRLRQDRGQTRDEVLDAYGRDRIADDDIVIIRRIVSPHFDDAGAMI